MQDSASWNSSSVSLPARRPSDSDQVLVPEPMSLPWYLPESIGPPETRIVGRSTLHAPMRVAGGVLSEAAGRSAPAGGVGRSACPTAPAARVGGLPGAGGTRASASAHSATA